MKKIILYGAGIRCIGLLNYIERGEIKIPYIIDSNKDKWGTFINGRKIYSPDILLKEKEVPICITLKNEEIVREIEQILKEKYKIQSENIVTYPDMILYAFQQLHCVKTRLNRKNKNEVIHTIFDCYKGLGIGGIEEWTKALCCELLKENIKNIRIMSDFGNYKIPDFLMNYVDNVKIDHKNLFEDETIISVLEYLMSMLPCVIITSQPSITLMVASILKNYFPEKIRIISTVHGGTDNIYENYIQYKNYIDNYITVSKDIQKALIKRGICKEKVYSITCPVSCTDNLVRKYTLDNLQPIQIGYAGRIEIAQKRMDYMIELLSLLEKKGVNYHFNIAGEGSALKQFQEKMKEYFLEDKVTYHGFIERSQINNFWIKQDIYVNVADFEGRSISQLEAMVNGVVPVATRTSGTTEDIIEGKNGYTVDIGDIKEMAKKIDFLSKDRKRLMSMGNLAHSMVYPKCNTNKHTLFWIQLIRSQEWILLKK